MKIRIYLAIIISFTILQTSLIIKKVYAQNEEIVINEICWMGSETSSSDEWIELFNKTDKSIDLEGWILASRDGQPEISLSGIILPNNYFLLERTDDNSVQSKEADLIYTGSLSNSGDYLELKNINNVVIDFVDSNNGWLAGDNSTKQTMERQFDGTWKTSNEIGGTPKSRNSINTSQNNNKQPLPTNEAEETRIIHNQLGIIVLNEIVSDPSDGDSEWIELYSNSNNTIDLTGWSLVEGGGATTALEGVILPENFYIIQDPKGNLNNDGDSIKLIDNDEQVIDQLTYGVWDDGYVENNASVAKDPNSLARIGDGYDTDNDMTDFIISEPTKGFANMLKMKKEEKIYSKGKIVLSEIFPNPVGNDNAEFIELKNDDIFEASILNYYIEDASKKRFIFTENFCNKFFDNKCEIESGEFIVLGRTMTGLYLNNSNEELYLYSSDGKLQDRISFLKSKEGKSYVSTPDGWLWTKTVTPGNQNIYVKINHDPVVDFSYSDITLVGRPIMFDASDTFDDDGDNLFYNWDFGDGFKNELIVPEHTYFFPGNYKVVLTVDDGENIKELSKIVVIEGEEVNGTKKEIIELGEAKIAITEIVPNPDGDDEEGEYIEIHNSGEYKVNLFDWVLDDVNGGSRPFVIEDELEIEPNSYYVFNRTDTGIVLNNNFDEVRLISPDKKTVESVKYEKAKSGYSFTKLENGEWTWTENLSPEREGSVVEGMSFDNELEKKQPEDFYINVDLKNIKDFKKGDKVRTRGVVAVVPGIFSAQYFYIVGSPGIQVYSYKSDFPALSVGDFVEVEGVLSEINGEQRLKTADRFAISFLQEEKKLQFENFDDVFDPEFSLARLVYFKGKVENLSKDNFVIESKDIKFPVKIKESSKIILENLNEGDEIEVSGVYCGGHNQKIYPREQKDLILLSSVSQNKIEKEADKKIEWDLPQRNNKQRKYFYTFSIILLVIAGIFFTKRKAV